MREQMYYVYILYSKRIDQYYVGHSSDLDDRITRHNKGKSLATKRGVPWECKFSTGFQSRSTAIRAEKWLKKMKSRRVIEKVIEGEIDLKQVSVG